jgi:phage protein D
MASERSFAAEPIVSAPGRLSKTWHRQLVRTVIEESTGRPDAAMLTFRDGDHELLTETGITIGRPLSVSVKVAQSQAATALFAGEVTALELEVDNTGSYTVVQARGRAHRLQRGRRVMAYRNMSAAAIVAKVAKNAGLTPGEITVPSVIYPQLTQAGVSDWDFLQDLAAQLGVVMRVDDKGRLDFGPPKPASDAPAPTSSAATSPVVLRYGANLRALRAALTSADRVDSVQVRGWHVDSKKRLLANVDSTPSETVRPDLDPAAGLFGTATALVVGTPYGTQAEADAAARSLAESMSAGLGELEAVVDGQPQLHAGTPVALAKAGPDFSGRYTATAVRHTIDPDSGYRTTVLVSATPDRSIGGLTSGVGPRARGPRFPGVATGIVTDVREPGNGERGWVKLKFPWLDDKYETDWARTVQLGGQGGGVFSPDVNDEVLVGFEQGCLDLPYVLGGLYNGRDLPSPHTLPLINSAGGVNRRSVVSRKGHRLELIDGIAGPPGVRVASGDNRLEVRLDAARDKLTLTVYGPGGRNALSSIELTSEGITIDAGAGNLDLKGTSVSVAGRTVSVTGETEATVDGGLLANLTGKLVRIN